MLPHASSNKLSRKHSLETGVIELKGMEASTSISSESIAAIANDTPRITEVREAICQKTLTSFTSMSKIVNQKFVPSGYGISEATTSGIFHFGGTDSPS